MQLHPQARERARQAEARRQQVMAALTWFLILVAGLALGVLGPRLLAQKS